MAVKRLRVKVKGTVQGVYFRTYAQNEGQQLGVSGWVQNLADGSVEAVIEGEEEKVDKLVEWLHIGSPLGKVTEVTVQEESPTGELGSFNIRY